MFNVLCFARSVCRGMFSQTVWDCLFKREELCLMYFVLPGVCPRGMFSQTVWDCLFKREELCLMYCVLPGVCPQGMFSQTVWVV